MGGQGAKECSLNKRRAGWARRTLSSPGANLQLCWESGVGVGAPRSGSIPLSQRLPGPGVGSVEQREISGAERRGASLGRSRWRRGGGAQIRGKGQGPEGPRVGKRSSLRGGLRRAQAQGVSVQEGPRVGGVRLEAEQWADRGSVERPRPQKLPGSRLLSSPTCWSPPDPRRACGSAGLIHRALEEILCLHSLL